MARSVENKLEVVLPVHNEADSIESTIMEIHNELAAKVAIEFIISEDGSQDGTKDVLLRLRGRIPMRLIMGDERKGYCQAVIDGFNAVTAPYVLCMDSDGQCDPADFWGLWRLRETAEIVIGWRTNRADPLFRRILSGTFKVFYRLLFRVRVHDPSCPYILIQKPVIDRLTPELGVLSQGFWWEFLARASRCGLRIVEVPVVHRCRTAGETRVYRLGKLPGIAASHITGLVKIWLQTRRSPV